MNISIRAETPGDIEAIARLTEAAFRNETHSSHTEQYIVDALRRAGALTLSLVAEANGQVIGHIAASPVTIDGEAGDWSPGPARTWRTAPSRAPRYCAR